MPSVTARDKSPNLNRRRKRRGVCEYEEERAEPKQLSVARLKVVVSSTAVQSSDF